MSDNLYNEIGSVTPDKLIIGEDVPLLIKGVTLAAGQGVLARGSVLGLKKAGAVTVVAGTNTGGGNVSGQVAGVAAKVGNYILKCIAVASNSGTFSVVDPNGNRLEDAVVGTAYSNKDIGFTLNDVGTDFAVGDSFAITVAAGSGQAKLVDKTAVDGSAIADCILADAVDTTAAVVAQAYKSGEFNKKALVFAANNTAADHAEALRLKGIFLNDSIAYLEGG